MSRQLMISFIIFAVTQSSIVAVGQTKTDFWVPEAYVEAVENNQTAQASNFLIPVAAFYDPFGKCEVLTYQSEFRRIKTKKTFIAGRQKVELVNLGSNINLTAKPPSGSIYEKANPSNNRLPMEAVAQKLNRSIVTLSKIDSNKLLMEIADSGSIERIYFVNTIVGKRLKDYKTVYSIIKYR